ncbi:MAG: glucose-1-phosphate thymidylyltransferase [Desulfurococcus sp.]|nr:glucose-1-phosphate thymidylyltransferase [Desulfurococcus sp.]
MLGEINVKGVVLHGGLGTRLRPLTHTGPKQLIPVAGKPVSQWVLEDLRDSGVRDIAVILGSVFPERVVAYYGDGSRIGVNLTYIYQGYPYGIAHAVYLARDFVGDEPFVVYLGDNIIASGIRGFVERFEESNADAMILLARVPDPQRFGVARFDENGRLIGLVEKPRAPPSEYALVGVYFFRPPYIFKAIEELKPSWRGELEITDAIQKLLDWGLRVDYAIVKGWWKDTGTPQDILDANRLLLDERVKETVIKGIVEPGAVIEGRVVVEEGVQVASSAVVRGPAYIGRGSILGENSYVGPYTSIGQNVVLRSVEVENSIVMDGARLENAGRIVESIIGAEAVVSSGNSIPRGHRFIIGEKSRVDL